MRTETRSLNEDRLFRQVKRNSGQGPQTFQEPEPPTDAAGAVRETLAAVITEIRQRQFSKITDHALLAHARRLIVLSRDLEREKARAARPPWWRRWWFWLNTRL